MGCFIALFALVSPRLALFLLWIFDYGLLNRAYDSWLVPVLGFFLLPWTTLAYAVMWNSGSRGIHGLEYFIVIIAFLADIGSYRQGEQWRSRST